MTPLGDDIRRWCQEESLSIVAEQDDEAGLAYGVTLAGEPAVSVSVRASGPQPSRVLLAHAFELSVPTQVNAEPDGPQRVVTLLERVSASRSALVECRPMVREGKPAAEVLITLHADGISKQSFFSALEEVRKVVRVVTWELEGISAATDILSDVRGLVEQTGVIASGMAGAAEGLRTPATAEEVAPPEEVSPAVGPAPAPQPAAVPEAPASPPEAAPAQPGPASEPAPAARFCPSCGKETKPGQRFCIGCGTSLEAQG